MKKIFKIVIFTVLVNCLIGSAIVFYVISSVVGTSFKGSNITVKDIILKDEGKREELKMNMLNKSSEMGSICAEKVGSMLSFFVPDKNIYSNKKEIPYPYEDPEEKINQATNDGIEEAFKILEQ